MKEKQKKIYPKIISKPKRYFDFINEHILRYVRTETRLSDEATALVYIAAPLSPQKIEIMTKADKTMEYLNLFMLFN